MLQYGVEGGPVEGRFGTVKEVAGAGAIAAAESFGSEGESGVGQSLGQGALDPFGGDPVLLV